MLRYIPMYLVPLAVLLLAGCAGGPPSAGQTLASLCSAWGTVKITLAARMDKLSDAQIAQIDVLNPAIRTTCRNPSSAKPADLSTVRRALATLRTIEGTAR